MALGLLGRRAATGSRMPLRRLSTAAPKGARETLPVLIHGRRRINHGYEAEFEEEFDRHARNVYSDNPDVTACFAFADHDEISAAYWHVFMARDSSFARRLVWPLAQEAERFYMRIPESPDAMHVYGGFDARVLALAKMWTHGCSYQFHQPLAGFIKADGAGECGPPLVGFTRRHVKPGRVTELASCFQLVCDRWYATVPGVLAATVSRDVGQPNVVHDLRIFANHAAYRAHADKSDPLMVDAMQTWFENYDISEPFTGELYLPDDATADAALRTSSIRDRPVVVGFSEFVYGGPGQLGPTPDMARGDDDGESR